VAKSVGSIFILFSFRINGQTNSMKCHSQFLFLSLYYVYLHSLVRTPSIDGSNITIALTSIEEHLSTDRSTEFGSYIEYQMLNLLAEFDVVKGQLKPSIRHLLRDRFLRLLEYRSNKLETIIRLLADHAFKLPQRMFLSS
jgi:hypothetical protein